MLTGVRGVRGVRGVGGVGGVRAQEGSLMALLVTKTKQNTRGRIKLAASAPAVICMRRGSARTLYAQVTKLS